MTKTINNNDVILIDPDEEAEVVAHLMLKMNALLSIKTVQLATTLSEAQQYRERTNGHFPEPVPITHHGRRKAYRINDIKNWLEELDK